MFQNPEFNLKISLMTPFGLVVYFYIKSFKVVTCCMESIRETIIIAAGEEETKPNVPHLTAVHLAVPAAI
jgi:hypothetical protein